MCGLSGVMSSSVSWGEEEMFRDLFNVSSLRGNEGAGVIVSQTSAMKKHPLIRTLKTPHISGSLAYSDELAELCKGRVNALIGHARYPTRGGVDIKVVHPHRFGHIVGVHNGTMNRVAGKDVKDQSDSAMLFQSFAENGVVETIKESDGSYALVWVDERLGTINFLRNYQRTLYFTNVGWQQNISTVYWASEREMLDFVFKRSYKGNNTWDTYLPVDTWFSYPLNVKPIIRPVDVVKDVRPTPKAYAMGERRGGMAATGTGDGTGTHNSGRYTSIREFRERNKTGDDLPWQNLNRPDTKVVALLPSPGRVSKQEQKRLRKAAEKELRDEAKRRERFLRDQAIARARVVEEGTPQGTELDDGQDAPPRTELREYFASLYDDLNDPLDDIGADNRYAHVEGKACAWCGTLAAAGDIVYPLHVSDIGDKTFICIDCSTNDSCAGFLGGLRSATVTP